jgi:2-oxo-4-hydroxy-4-carboxy-5-ureidoimidazoline decarboxylase
MTDLAAINALNRTAFIDQMANVYEHGRWAAEIAEAARPFASFDRLRSAFAQAIQAAPVDRQLALICAHPELPDRKKRASLTMSSRDEQEGAGLDALSDEEFEQFSQLNESYRQKFAFPFIICVRRHTKDSIMAEFRTRLEHDRDEERKAALIEIDRIAALRLTGIVDDIATAALAGVLSTHVLDTHSGRPASGVDVSLHELCAFGAPRLVARRVTNALGRIDTPLISGRPIPQGRYELRFAVGAYFASVAPEASFLDIVPVRFMITEPEAHYHIPLLVTPWSYTTYRGN